MGNVCVCVGGGDGRAGPDEGCVSAGDGRSRRRHVHLLQDVDASGSDRSQEAHGEGSADRGGHATRYRHASDTLPLPGRIPLSIYPPAPPPPYRVPPSLLPWVQHHPRPEGAFPHVADGGAAAGSGGAAGGRVRALHHHQTVRLLPVRHQRHHVTRRGDAFRAAGKLEHQEGQRLNRLKRMLIFLSERFATSSRFSFYPLEMQI